MSSLQRSMVGSREACLGGGLVWAAQCDKAVNAGGTKAQQVHSGQPPAR